jgi:hypothetical protein
MPPLLELVFPITPNLARELDKMMRGDLELWSNLWFWTLVGSTIVVVIGIFLEAPEVFHAVGLGRKTTSRIRAFWYIHVRKIDLAGWEKVCPELITERSHNERKIAIFGLVGWILVAIGVAGEGYAEYWVSDAETEIRAFDEVRV